MKKKAIKTFKNNQAILIYNARLISDKKIIPHTWILVQNAKISKIGCGLKPVLKNTVYLNAKSGYVSPGFIDLHIHGDIRKISNMQVKTGTTGFLHSLHTRSINQFSIACEETNGNLLKGARCLGLHLEGPFINKMMAGAQPKKDIIAPDIKALRLWIKKAQGMIKVVTIAPELKKSMALIKELEKNKIVASIGHTDASIEQAKRAIDSGCLYSTHVFNRMSGISSRNPGVLAQILLDDRITAEVIADSHHVHPDNLRLLVKCKPMDRIVLVSDSVAAMDNKSLQIIAGVYRLENYVIAGSKLNLLQAVKNMVYLCGVSLVQAVNMASLNPARIIGVDNVKGRILKGYDADIVIFDKDFKCTVTIVNGEIVYNKI